MSKAPQPAQKATKTRDTYKWSAEKISALISAASGPENIRTLLGKQEAGENTSGDTKVKVYGRIAAEIFPDEYPANPKLWRTRVQNKWEYLGQQYRTAAKRLRSTGEGVRPNQDPDGNDPDSQGIAKIELDHYIPPTGPDHDTPDVAKNIWGEITRKFPWFPRMHELLSTRPNQVPIAVTTGLTPSGPVTIFHQPPSDSEDNEDQDDSQLPPLKIARTGARPSTQIQAARKAFGTKAGPKHQRLGIEERFLQIQEQLQARVFERDKNAQQLAEREVAVKEKQQLIERRQQLIEEFKLGLITTNEYREAVAHLGGDSYVRGNLSGSSQPLQVGAHFSGNFSPEWDSQSLPVPSEFAAPSAM
ncbi:hypothetical protein FRC09_005697 [Ceratobasidium sp. 395]|nr:hypothetical protein FRC09_005697 [Ceratobasidium sp. 395]